MSARRVVARLVQVGLALALIPSCKTTLHSIGCGENGYTLKDGATLAPLRAPGFYPNAFRDVLGKSDADITAKTAGNFADSINQLFLLAIFAMRKIESKYIYTRNQEFL